MMDLCDRKRNPLNKATQKTMKQLDLTIQTLQVTDTIMSQESKTLTLQEIKIIHNQREKTLTQQEKDMTTFPRFITQISCSIKICKTCHLLSPMTPMVP